MAQKTFVAGVVLTASDINTYLAGEGGAWTTYTPTLSQGASSNIAKTVNYSKYARYGRMITWTFDVSPTAGGTAGSNVTLTLPVTASSSAGLSGSGRILDTSTSTTYVTEVTPAGTTTVVFYHATGGVNGWGTAPNLAIASGDNIRGSITYEAAS